MRRASFAIVLAACHPPHAHPLGAPSPMHITAAPPPSWPIAVRVLVRGEGGALVVAGTLDANTDVPIPPGDDWFVEPVRMAGDPAPLFAEIAANHAPGLALRDLALPNSYANAIATAPLIALDLDGDRITVEDAAALHGAQVRRLSLRGVDADAATLATLAALPLLEVLDVDDTAATDATIDAALPGLHVLSASRTNITEAAAPSIARQTALDVLALSGTHAGDQIAAAAGTLPLTGLYLDGTDVTDRGAAALAPLAPGLRKLELSDTAVTDRGLPWLGTASALTSLGLGDTTIADHTLAGVALLASLEELDLPRTHGSAKALAAALAGKDHLRSLDLAETKADDAVATAALALPDLDWLRLDDTAVSDAGLANLAAAKVRSLYLARTKVTDSGLAALASHTDMQAIGIRGTHAGEPTLAILATLQDLTTVDIGDLPVGTPSLAPVVALPHLDRLYIDNTGADDTTIAAIRAPLTVLHAGKTTLDGDAVPALARLTTLTEVALERTQLTNSIGDAIDAWPGLATLTLAHDAVDDALVPRLAARGNLRTLDLSASDVTRVGDVARLPHLEALGLAETSVDDDEIALLAAHPRLAQLSLAGDALTVAILPTLESLPRLADLDVTGVPLPRRTLANLRKRGVVVEGP